MLNKKSSKTIAVIAAISMAALSLGGCASSKNIDGVRYQPYGLFDKEEHRKTNVEYEVSVGNVVLSIIFFETIFVPLILIGWYLYYPVELKKAQ